MNARELAAELATLEKSQREQLLSELPEIKRAELMDLIRELEPMLSKPSTFELVMAEMKKNSAPKSDFLRDESRLSQLLGAETIAVKKHLMEVFVGGQVASITPHVRSIVVGYLEDRQEKIPITSQPSVRKKNAWARFWKMNV